MDNESINNLLGNIADLAKNPDRSYIGHQAPRPDKGRALRVLAKHAIPKCGQLVEIKYCEYCLGIMKKPDYKPSHWSTVIYCSEVCGRKGREK